MHASRYFDPAQAALEDERVFRRVWLFAAHQSELDVDGAFVRLDVGRASYLLTRSKGQVRAFVNLCSHRGVLLCDEHAGTSVVHRCPYHGWEYGCDGGLIRAPGAGPMAQGAKLREIGCATRAGLVFLSADPQRESLDAFLGPMGEALDRLGGAELSLVGDRTAELGCNWKVSADLHNEGYHLGALHPGIEAHVDLDGVRFRPLGIHSSFTIPLRAPEGPREKEQLFLFPNVALNFTGGELEVYRHRPHRSDPGRMAFDELRYGPGRPRGPRPPRVRLDHDGAGIGKALSEDLAIAPRIQQGLETGDAQPFRLTPLEASIAHFHAALDHYVGAP
jgi:phenylpropionate dioxygenase-like ring-hydroxylating dioxygenase large terminal subunit